MVDKTTLERLFHMPLRDAASALGVCPTAIKCACRKLGLSKWPYRSLCKHRRLSEGGEHAED